MIRKLKNLLNDLAFWGYQKEEYKFKNNTQLRSARNAFETQIGFVTVISFILIVFEIVCMGHYVSTMEMSDFLKATSLHIEIIFTAVALVLTVIGIFSTVACGILAGVYLVASGLLLFFGNSASMLFCILCCIGYVRAFFSHVHIGYVKKYRREDDFEEIRKVLKDTNDIRIDVKETFRLYENGGEPSGDSTEETELRADFSQEELDAILGVCQNPRVNFAFDDVNPTTLNGVEK